MSLINEALKRAEAEKHGQAYQAPECGEGVSPSRPAGIPDRGPLGLPALGSPTNSAKRQATPSQQDLNLAGETTAPRMTSPRRHLVPWAIVAVLALAGGPLALRVWMGTGTPASQSADAAVPLDRLNIADPTPPAARSVVKPPAPPVEIPPAPIVVAAAPVSGAMLPDSFPEACSPGLRPHASADDRSAEAWHLADAPPSVPATPPATVAPMPVPAPMASQPAVPATASASEPSYKLTGTMRGSDGWTAVINGQVVQVGETIDDAKVIKITAKNVTLDTGGKRLTLGL